jgi:PAS domain S-box-containing protein
LESENQVAQLSDFMPQIVWTAQPNGDVDFWNQRWYDYTGLNFSETKDSRWLRVLHPNDLEQTLRIWNHSLQHGDLYETKYRMRRYDGEYRWKLARGMPFRNMNGEIVRWFGTCTDIHDQKTAEEQLEILVAERTYDLQRTNEDLQQLLTSPAMTLRSL